MTGSGKTVWVQNLLQQASRVIQHLPQRIVWSYSQWQPAYEQMQQTLPGIKFVKDIPHDLDEDWYLDPQTNNLIVIDDQMAETSNDQRILNLFTKGSHHRNLSVIFLCQNVYFQGKIMRTLSLNAAYLVLFKNPRYKLQITPRYKLQITTLGKQMYPGMTDQFLHKYEAAVKRPYGYLFVDLKPNTPEECRLRTNVLPNDPPQTGGHCLQAFDLIQAIACKPFVLIQAIACKPFVLIQAIACKPFVLIQAIACKPFVLIQAIACKPFAFFFFQAIACKPFVLIQAIACKPFVLIQAIAWLLFIACKPFVLIQAIACKPFVLIQAIACKPLPFLIQHQIPSFSPRYGMYLFYSFLGTIGENINKDGRRNMATMDDYIDQLLAEMGTPEALQRVVHNILDEPIPEAVKRQLLKPLLPAATRPSPPPRGKRGRRERNRKAVLEEFDPVPVQKRLRTVQDYQKEGLALQKEETGEEKGRRFIRWWFSQDPGEDLTQRIMTKLRERIDTAFYLRYLYTYEIRHVEDGTIIQFRKNLGGSLWCNRLAEAETWLSHDNINRPNTKWVFVRFISTVVKVVLDRQPLMGTVPLQDWLRNRAHGQALVALDAYRDNMFLWR
ncbi:hypothetical protein QZH41_002125 [Actinostola sp. cb2023]|nr:hypothetical protein QZH41_002125 [Actinostola sp. cb2023]